MNSPIKQKVNYPEVLNHPHCVVCGAPLLCADVLKNWGKLPEKQRERFKEWELVEGRAFCLDCVEKIEVNPYAVILELLNREEEENDYVLYLENNLRRCRL